MKQKLFTLMTLLVMCVTGAWGASVVWTFTSATSGTIGTAGNIVTFTSTDASATTLTYVSGKSDDLVSSSATIGGVDYTKYLKENGSGSATSRVKKFNAPYAKFRITVVYAGTAGGTTTIRNNTTGTDLGTISAAASSAVTSGTFNATIGNEIAIYCGTKSYIYSIICEEVNSGKEASSFALTSDDEVEVAIDGNSTITTSGNAGTVTYTSNNTDVATVTDAGVITAKAGGKTTITVSDPGTAEVDGKNLTVTVLVPYPNPAAADSYVLNQDSYDFANKDNTKYYFKNGFTMDVSGGGAELQNGALAKSKKYSHARGYTINVPSNVTVTYAVFTARSNYNTEQKATWGTVFGTDYSAIELPQSNQDPAEKDFVIVSPTAGGTLAFTPGGNQWQAILNLYTIAYKAKYTVSFDAGEGTGSMEGTEVREGSSYTLPGSSFTPPAEKGFAGWRCSIDGKVYAAGANYTMTDAATTFTAMYADYAGSSIIKATVKATNAATVIGSIGGTADVNLQNGGSDGWKFGGDTHHIGITLAAGKTFQAGDIINVHITKVQDTGGEIIFYNEDKSVIYDTNDAGVLGDNKYVLTDDFDGKTAIYLYRLTASNNWNAYIDYVEVTRPASGIISASGWNTFSCASPLDLSTISGGTAYYASAAEGSTVTLATTTAKVPAGEGLMIKGTPGETFTIEVATSGTAISGNKLIGLPYGGTVTKNNHNYVFGWATAAPEAPGFYLINDTEPALAAGKSYLHADADLSARLSIDFGEGDVTAINKIEAAKQNVGEYFNLAGQRVAQPTKGLYIVNGKKVVLK